MATHSERKPIGEMELQVASQLEGLRGMTRPQLQRRWLELFPTAAHPRLSRSLLVSILSYRIQEEAFGGLSAELSGRLRVLGQNAHRGSRRQPSWGEESKRTATGGLRKKKPATRVRLKPGTRLLRQWRGQTYAVTVVEHGYEYGDKVYKSLSEIAGVITGSRWSGPLFFGLKVRSREVCPGQLEQEAS